MLRAGCRQEGRQRAKRMVGAHTRETFCVYLRTSDKEESLSSDLGGQKISWIRG